MDLTKIDGEVTHRFRQQIRVDGENLPLPKVNDTLWQGLKRVEAQWTSCAMLRTKLSRYTRNQVST